MDLAGQQAHSKHLLDTRTQATYNELHSLVAPLLTVLTMFNMDLSGNSAVTNRLDLFR